MPFVTTVTLQSGDRETLERVATRIKERAEQKGVELRGPNPEPLETRSVPQHARLSAGDERYDPWEYTVYTRTLIIVGHDDFAREVAAVSYPDSVHVQADVEQVRTSG